MDLCYLRQDCYLKEIFILLIKNSLTIFFLLRKSSVKNKKTNSYQKHIQDFINSAKSFISNMMQEKWDVKVTKKVHFSNKCYFSIFFWALFFGM